VLDRLEGFRDRLEGLFARTPFEVAVVLHPRPLALSLAHPWLPLARLAAAPASRRYFAGWFSAREIHVLAPAALEARASSTEGSLDALMLTPQHEYAHLVIGANNPELPPPFTPVSFRRYLAWAWLCEGAATYLSGQVPHLRAAIVRRLREGPRPEFPPSARDAFLLGGSLFALLAEEAGPESAAALAEEPPRGGSRELIERAFGRRLHEVERDWREQLDSLRAAA
jgi:hypothetical protein